MADTQETTQTTTETDPATGATPTTDDGLGDAGKKAISDERKQRRDAEKRANALEAELAALRQQSMTEQERAVESARAEGRAEATKMLGAARVESAFAVAATGRLEQATLKVLLPGLDHGAFMTDDGNVDQDKVDAFIDGIAPKGQQRGPLDLGQGSRLSNAGGTGGQSADPLERSLIALSNKRA